MGSWVDELQQILQEVDQVAIVTIVEAKGSTPRKIGAKMFVMANGKSFGSVGGGLGEKLAIEEAVKCLQEKRCKTFSVDLTKDHGQVCGGKVDFLIEIVGSSSKLHIFGAGHVGHAICQVLIDTPFEIHLIDDRPEWVESSAIPKGINCHCMNWLDYINSASWGGEKSFAVVVTYDHKIDFEIVSKLAHFNLEYCGLIGSKGKWANFKPRLLERGVSEDSIEKIKCPIGLFKSGNTPKEIAVSLGAELLSKL